MGSAGHDGRSRPSRGRRPEARLAGRRRNGKAPLLSPVRIRWHRTPVVGKEEGSGRLNSWTPVVALTGGGPQTIVNELPRRAVCSLRESSAGLAEPAAAR